MSAAGPTLALAGVPFALPVAHSSLPPALQAALEPALATDGAERVRALGPGILALGGRLIFVLPRCYRSEVSAPAGGDPEAEAAAMALTVSILSRYRGEKPRGAVERASVSLIIAEAGEPGAALDRVEAALALWSDWRARGPLVLTRERRSDHEPGRIHWPETLRRGQGLVQREGLVHGRVIRTRVRPDPFHELSALHRRSCAAIGRSLGLPGPQGPPRPVSSLRALEVIARNARRCFADRQRRVLSLLERYHRPASGGRGRGLDRVVGLFAPEFEFVWERMLAVALGHRPIREGLTGSYRLPGGRLLPGLSLRPDLLFEVPGEPPWLMVLDAKHYDYGDWPRTADLTKQLLYRLLLSDRLEGGRSGAHPLGAIGSGFLFPSRRLGASPAAIRGVHDLDLAGDPGRPGRVVGLDVDFERVARAYLSGRVDRGLRRAITALVQSGMR